MNEILRLIKDEVCMGTYGLVELELRKLVVSPGSASDNTGSPKLPSLDEAIKYGENIGIREACMIVFMDWLARQLRAGA
jgi:hypothetical protein